MKKLLLTITTLLFITGVNANEKQWNGSFFEDNPLTVGIPINEFLVAAKATGHNCGDLVQLGDIVVVCGHKDGSDTHNGQTIQGYSEDGKTISKVKIGCAFVGNTCDVEFIDLFAYLKNLTYMIEFIPSNHEFSKDGQAVAFSNDNVIVELHDLKFRRTPYEFVILPKNKLSF